jgi:hypothetical protein
MMESQDIALVTHQSRTAIIPPLAGAKCAVANANRCLPAKGFKNAPRADADVPIPANVEVIDARHPLYGRRFKLVSVIRGTCSDSRVRVKWRFGLTLLLPLEVTNLVPRNEQRTTPTKLSIEAMEELVAVAEGSEGACPSSLGRSGAIYRQRCAGRSSTISPRSCGR